VGPRVGLDGCGKSRPPPGFDPRTVQPVVSRYTDRGTRPTFSTGHIVINGKVSLERPLGFQEVEAPKSRQMKMARLSAHAPAVFTPRKYSWYPFVLEDESTSGP
jgi:hypothetical protein